MFESSVDEWEMPTRISVVTVSSPGIEYDVRVTTASERLAAVAALPTTSAGLRHLDLVDMAAFTTSIG